MPYSETVKFEVGAGATDLHRVEALVAALARRMGGTREQAASVIRHLETERRRASKARVGAPARVVVGRARALEVRALLQAVGWSLRDTVERKLPLLELPQEIKDAVRRGRLAPSKALVLARIGNAAERGAQLEDTLARGTSVRQLEARVLGVQRTIAQTRAAVRDAQLDADLRWLALEIERQLGTRVALTETAVTLECGSGEGLSDLLERLGVRL
jgi:ParB family chromosome partitioning protein